MWSGMNYPHFNQLCTLGQLRVWLERSPLAQKCVIRIDDLDQVIRGLETVRKLARNWDEQLQRPLLAAVSMLLLIHGPVSPQKPMRSLLVHVLGLLDTKDPMSVHGHVEYVLDALRQVNADQATCLLRLALGLIQASPRGLAMGVCLLWWIVGQILQLEITMHRYREFKELADGLGPVARFSLFDMDVEQLDKLDILLEAINRIFNLVLLSNNEELKLAGYPEHFFQMRREDVESMLNWATTILFQIGVNYRYMPDFAVIDGQVRTMIGLLNRIKVELPELVELQPKPKLFQSPVDTYSDLDD